MKENDNSEGFSEVRTYVNKVFDGLHLELNSLKQEISLKASQE